jgi:hypothetical protein
MWQTVGKYALKVAVWAYGHPDEVKAALNILGQIKAK